MLHGSIKQISFPDLLNYLRLIQNIQNHDLKFSLTHLMNVDLCQLEVEIRI